MNSEIINASFVLSANNLSYQKIITQIAAIIGVKAPKNAAKTWQLSLLSFFQKVAGIFTGKSPSLNKESINSLQKISEYNGDKITKMTSFTYNNIDDTINRVSMSFKKQY